MIHDGTTEPRYQTDEYPVLSVTREPAANGVLPQSPSLETATFIGRISQPNGLALVRLTGTFLNPKEVLCLAVTPGFRVALLPERTAYRRAIIAGVEVERLDPSAPAACVVRFCSGPSSVQVTIAVPETS
ncbi:MAG: hypothetical protein JKY37_03915 [Nannocystaceae bacterium]|nr:hypothetical protein [Nannocystaceae bacterium]